MIRRFLGRLLVLVVAASSPALGRADEPPHVAAPVLAVAGQQTVTADELEKVVRPGLIRIEQATYSLKRRAVEQILFRKLLQEEARRQGISVEQLRQKEIGAKANEVPEGEIALMLKGRGGNSPEDPAAARAEAIEYLKQRRAEGIEEMYRKRLFARYGAEIRLEPPRVEIAGVRSAPSRGPSTAPVTIVIFSDFQCPGCGQARTILDDVLTSYTDRTRVVFMQFPLRIHAQAHLAAEASLCAADQGKFWAIHDWLFAHQQSISRESLLEGPAGVAQKEFAQCLESGRQSPIVDRQVETALQLGLSGTPAVFVNGRFMNVPLNPENLRDLVDEELRARSRSATH